MCGAARLDVRRERGGREVVWVVLELDECGSRGRDSILLAVVVLQVM